MKMYLIVLNVVARLACWCRGKTFPSPSKYFLTTLMTFKIPNITWDVRYSFGLYVGLQRPGWLYVLEIPPRADLRLWPPENVPRTSARAQTCVRGPGGLPEYHGAESTRKAPRPKEKNYRWVKKKNIYIYVCIYKVSLRDVHYVKSRGWRKLKRDTHVTQQ